MWGGPIKKPAQPWLCRRRSFPERRDMGSVHRQLAVLHGDGEGGAGHHIPGDELPGDEGLHRVLDVPTQGPGAEGGS